MSDEGPGRAYLAALARELRVGRRYRRRALAEITDHIEEVSERERRLGASAEEAERVAIGRLGAVDSLADDLSVARGEAVVLARERALRLISVLGAALAVACASLASVTLGGGDDHVGPEAVSAVAAALAVMLIDGSSWLSARVGLVLVCVVAVWIAATATLISDGDVVYCGLVLLGVSVAAVIVHSARRFGYRPRRGGP